MKHAKYMEIYYGGHPKRKNVVNLQSIHSALFIFLALPAMISQE